MPNLTTPHGRFRPKEEATAGRFRLRRTRLPPLARKRELASRNSGRFPIVVFKDATESLFALDLGRIKRNDIVLFDVRISTGRGQQPVVQTLMRTAFMVIGDVFADGVVKVVLAENPKVVQRFLLQRLNPALLSVTTFGSFVREFSSLWTHSGWPRPGRTFDAWYVAECRLEANRSHLSAGDNRCESW